MFLFKYLFSIIDIVFHYINVWMAKVNVSGYKNDV